MADTSTIILTAFSGPLAAIGVFLMQPQATWATTAFETGNTLYAQCTASESWQTAACEGYVDGVFDVLVAGNKINNFSACFGMDAVNMNRLQIKDIVVKYLRDHPDYRHLAASGIVADAFASAFPCK